LVRALMVIQSTPSTSKWGLLVAAGEFGNAITHAARLSSVFCLWTNFISYVVVAWQCYYLVFSTCCYQTFRWCQFYEQICQLNSGMFNYAGFWLLKCYMHVINKLSCMLAILNVTFVTMLLVTSMTKMLWISVTKSVIFLWWYDNQTQHDTWTNEKSHVHCPRH
jgi:hypothetical protein